GEATEFRAPTGRAVGRPPPWRGCRPSGTEKGEPERCHPGRERGSCVTTKGLRRLAGGLVVLAAAGCGLGNCEDKMRATQERVARFDEEAAALGDPVVIPTVRVVVTKEFVKENGKDDKKAAPKDDKKAAPPKEEKKPAI